MEFTWAIEQLSGRLLNRKIYADDLFDPPPER